MASVSALTAIQASSKVLVRHVRARARGLGIDITPDLCVQVISDYRHARFQATCPQLYDHAWTADPVTTYGLTKKSKRN
jgi:hypothetical protein